MATVDVTRLLTGGRILPIFNKTDTARKVDVRAARLREASHNDGTASPCPQVSPCPTRRTAEQREGAAVDRTGMVAAD